MEKQMLRLQKDIGDYDKNVSRGTFLCDAGYFS